MATTAPNQIPSDSYDSGAVSVVVSNRSTADSRPGSFFSADFAAVSPVYFHELDSSKFVGIFSRRWSDVSRAADATDPNLFSGYTEDTLPSWAIFDGSNGHHHSIPGQYGITPPTRIACDTRVVVGACSRTNTYLYLMQSYTDASGTFGVASHFHIDPVTWQVNLIGEEKLSNIVVGGETITFDLGIKYNVTFLHFVGRDSLNRLYLARKNWGFIGREGREAQIEYQSDKGWTADPSKIKPLRTPTGYLTSAGPVGFADYRGKTWLSAVEIDGGAVTAQVYTSGGLWDTWTPENPPYALGTEGSSYLGGTVHFQPMLRAQPSRISPTCVTGIPLVYATQRDDGDDSAIDISWDLWPIRVQNSTLNLTAEAVLNATSDAPTT